MVWEDDYKGTFEGIQYPTERREQGVEKADS